MGGRNFSRVVGSSTWSGRVWCRYLFDSVVMAVMTTATRAEGARSIASRDRRKGGLQKTRSPDQS